MNFSDIFPSWDFGRKLVSSRYIEFLYNNFGWYYSLATPRTVVRWGGRGRMKFKNKRKKKIVLGGRWVVLTSQENCKGKLDQPARKLEPFQSFSSLSGCTAHFVWLQPRAN